MCAITSNGSCLEGKGLISDQISGILRAHLTNGILSMFPPSPPLLQSLIFTRRNVNVATACACCLWSLLFFLMELDGYYLRKSLSLSVSVTDSDLVGCDGSDRVCSAHGKLMKL